LNQYPRLYKEAEIGGIKQEKFNEKKVYKKNFVPDCIYAGYCLAGSRPIRRAYGPGCASGYLSQHERFLWGDQ
jgi:hypothetical protein